MQSAEISFVFRVFSILLIVSSTIPMSAKASELVTLQVKNKKIQFVSDPGKHLTISKNCQSNEKFHCKAYSAMMGVAKSTSSTEKQPPEISAALCKKQKGQTTMGLTEKKDEMGLCYFKSDNSYIDLGSLYAKAMAWN